MVNPTHPGESIRNCIDESGWTVTECAARLGVTRNNLSRLLNGRIGISATVAARVKSPVGGAAGSCGRSARSEEDGDPGDLLRRTTKLTTANVRRPKGYAPLPLGCEESAAPRSWNGWALRHRFRGA